MGSGVPRACEESLDTQHMAPWQSPALPRAQGSWLERKATLRSLPALCLARRSLCQKDLASQEPVLWEKFSLHYFLTTALSWRGFVIIPTWLKSGLQAHERNHK